MKRRFILGSMAVAIAALAFSYVDIASVDAASKDDKKALETSAAPSASTTIVISQVFGGGGGTTGTYSADYVELKNISATPQSMDTLRIMYGSATGQFGSSAGNIHALPNTTLAPGQYFLIQLGTVGAGGLPVPSPDQTNTTTNLSGASGKVALVTTAFTGNTCGATATPCTLPNAAIIDVVSYGAANNAEGGTPTNGGVAVTSTQGSVRKAAGCTDTDNNNADHDIITAPVPRNSTSPVAVCGAAPPQQHVLDFNGDGKTDWTVVRNVGGGANGQLRWFYNLNGTGGTVAFDWGLAGDTLVAADYDGDQKSDIAVWRSGPALTAAFYILQSQTNTVRVEPFGQNGDDPRVVADYNGDGKADLAVYRPGANVGAQSTWFYRTTANGSVTYVPWGVNGDKTAPGDYDGDGKADFVVMRNSGAQNAFWMLQSTAGFGYTLFGTAAVGDTTSPIRGDFDGDGKTDIAIADGSNPGFGVISYQPSSGGSYVQFTGAVPSTDRLALGDYDGDGKTDIAVWRNGIFWVRNSSSGNWQNFELGAAGDFVPYEGDSQPN